MSRDPLGEAGGLNLYGYAGGDPINHFDPNGLNPIDTFKAWVNRSLFGDEKKPCDSGEAGDSDYAAAGQLADNNQRGIKVSATLAKHAYNGIYNELPKQLILGSVFTGAALVIGDIRFGEGANQVYHAFRHIDKAGFGREAVQEAIVADLSKVAESLPSGLHSGSVTVDGVRLEYNAYKLADGTINVGRITPPR